MPPATSKGNKGRSLVAKPNTRAELRANGEFSINEDQQDINDVTEGRRFLEKHLLLCPPGEPPTHTSLATCLYQVSAMTGVTKPVLNAIRSIAFMLEEMEETQISTTVKEALDSQIDAFTLDMKTLIEDAKEKLDGHFKNMEE